MFLTSNNEHHLHKNFESIGLQKEIHANKGVLIKINLSGTYYKYHPRTDMTLLKKLVDYIYQNGGRCALAEASNGYLEDNLLKSGFDDIIKLYNIKIIDIDSEEYDEVVAYEERHYIPKVFKAYPVRIAVPSTSKRRDMLYSNNIKLFVGAVPRKKYQMEDESSDNNVPRPRIHENLHLSVSNLFCAIQGYSSFNFFVNGGLSYNENIGEFTFTDVFVGNDAYELDSYLHQTFFSDCEYPEYLDIIKERS